MKIKAKIIFGTKLMIARTFIITIFCLCACVQSLAQVQPIFEITDIDYQKAMQSVADGFLDRFDNMPRVPFRLKDDPRYYDEYGREHALAFYTRDENYKPVIYVNPKYSNRATYKQIVNTVLHELVHAWVDWKKISDNIAQGHGEAFIKKAIELGLNIDSTLIAFPDARKIYDRLTKGMNVGDGDRDDNGQGRTFVGKCDPVKEVGCFGVGIYNYQFFDQTEDPNAIQFVESRLFKVVTPPAVGSYVEWKNSTWRVHSSSGSTIWLIRLKVNCNPVKDVGCYGKNTYNYQFVSDADDREKIKVIENTLVEVSGTPTVGMIIIWRNQRWRCYAVTGSIAWFTEADNPVSSLAAVREDDDEYYYIIPSDGQWYQAILPKVSYSNAETDFYKIRLDLKKKSISILVDNNLTTLDNDHYWTITVSPRKELLVKSNLIQTSPLKLRFKVVSYY